MKPRNLSEPKQREAFLRSLAAMSQVRVVRHRPTAAARGTLVVIGASTGGPPALERLVRALPGDFAPPVLVAQLVKSRALKAPGAQKARTESLRLISLREKGAAVYRPRRIRVHWGGRRTPDAPSYSSEPAQR